MEPATRICSLHSVLISLVTKVGQVILCLSLYQQKCSLSIMYVLAWNIFVLQASLWALYVILAEYAVKLPSAGMGGLPTGWQLSPEAGAEKGLTQWLWAAEHPLVSHTGRSDSEPLKVLTWLCELYQEFRCPREPVSVISRLAQWEALPGLHCLLPVIPFLHTNRLHEEPEFENTAREALSFSLINSLLP